MNANELIASLAAEGAKKPLPHPLVQAVKWFGWMMVYFVAAAWLVEVRSDLSEKWLQPHYLVELGIITLGAVLSLVAASFLSLPDVGQRAWIRFLPLLPFVVIAGILLQNSASGDGLTLAECLRSGEYECMIYIVVFSILPAIGMFTAISRAAPTHRYWAGAMAGLSASSFGYLSLRLVDPHDDATMMIVWHYIPMLCIVLCCMLAGKVFFRRALA
jgi:hypothetical protein